MRVHPVQFTSTHPQSRQCLAPREELDESGPGCACPSHRSLPLACGQVTQLPSVCRATVDPVLAEALTVATLLGPELRKPLGKGRCLSPPTFVVQPNRLSEEWFCEAARKNIKTNQCDVL